MKYLSLILVLSFFIFHKIFFVLIGIILSLYELNRNYFIYLLKTDNKDISNNEENKTKISLTLKSENIETTNKNSRSDLVDIVEELGFIPSLDKNNDTHAA